MKFMISSLFNLLILTGIFTGCSKDSNDTHQTTGKSGLVSGKVTDAKGNAIAGATIVAEHTVWYDTYVNSVSDATGQYRINIPANPAGSWTTKAQISKIAWGQTYVFDLAADKTDPFNSSQNAARNFVWKLHGQRVGGYYGAHVDVYAFGVSVPMEEVKLIFTPYPGETLIDGTPAMAIERTIEDVAGTFMAKDIPVGKYTLKAVHGNKNLLLDYRHNSGKPETSKIVVFGKYGYLAETEYNISFWLSE